MDTFYDKNSKEIKGTIEKDVEIINQIFKSFTLPLESTKSLIQSLEIIQDPYKGNSDFLYYIIDKLIKRELEEGKKVELYMITSPKVKSRVCGLFDCNKEIEVASFKEMEDRCKEDYYNKEGKYPDWNFQENNESYSKKYNDIYKEYLEYHENRTAKK